MYEQVTRKPLGKAKLFSKYCGKPIIRFVLAQYDRLDNAVVFVKGGSEASRFFNISTVTEDAIEHFIR